MAEQLASTGPADVADVSVTVLVRYFAAARAAAGVPEERLTLPVRVTGQADTGTAPAAGARSGESSPRVITVAGLLAAAAERHGPELDRVLRRCSFLLDETAVHGTETAVRDGQVLDVLPPFAGG